MTYGIDHYILGHHLNHSLIGQIHDLVDSLSHQENLDSVHHTVFSSLQYFDCTVHCNGCSQRNVVSLSGVAWLSLQFPGVFQLDCDVCEYLIKGPSENLQSALELYPELHCTMILLEEDLAVLKLFQQAHLKN